MSYYPNIHLPVNRLFTKVEFKKAYRQARTNCRGFNDLQKINRNELSDIDAIALESKVAEMYAFDPLEEKVGF